MAQTPDQFPNPGPGKAATGRFWPYARFGAMNTLIVITIITIAWGGLWMWSGFALIIAITTIGDELGGDEVAEPLDGGRWLFDALLYMTLPLLILLSLLYCVMLSGNDPLNLSSLAAVMGLGELAANRTGTSWWHLLGGAMSIGICYGVAGINVAHELIHRTERLYDPIIGRWLLAFNLDTTFLVEHIDGHHRNAGTESDPATARRGQYIVSFVVTSTVGGFLNAFALERDRLRAAGESPWSFSNRAARGQLMSLAYATAFYWLAGWPGILAFIFMAINGKVYLELVNFIEHYGLVRVPGTPIARRHSWDSRRAISSAILYNLTRHPDHHVNARKPYYEREQADRDAPVMPLGYGAMITMAIFRPRAWRNRINPVLAYWDDHLASDGEQRLVAQRGWAID